MAGFEDEDEAPHEVRKVVTHGETPERYYADTAPSASERVPASIMKERLTHPGWLSRVQVSISSIVALECGHILGTARRALWTSVNHRSRNILVPCEIPRSFGCLAPPEAP